MIPRHVRKLLHISRWKEEEAYISFQLVSQWAACHLHSMYAYRKRFWSCSMFTAVNDYCHEYLPYAETQRMLAFVFRQFVKNRRYLQKPGFVLVNRQIGSFFVRVRDGDVRSYTDAQLKDGLLAFSSLGNRMYGYGIISECLDVLEDADYAKRLIHVPAAQRAHVLSALTTPTAWTVFQREKLSLLLIAREAARRGFGASARKMLQQHAQEYFWMQNDFRQVVYLDEGYFREEAAKTAAQGARSIAREIALLEGKGERIAREQHALQKRYRLTAEDILFFQMVRELASIQDKRKENVQKLVFCLDRILLEIGKRRRVPRKELNDYTAAEMMSLMDRRERIARPELRKRKNLVLLNRVAGRAIRTEYFFGEDARQIISLLEAQKKHGDALQGFVASPGRLGKRITGRVRVVFDPLKEAFQKGEILVTGMTRPEFVPLMKKARAIITNEGGITTHAAVVSRELGVACIIGTRQATKMLRTGDRVVLDMEKGTVKKA